MTEIIRHTSRAPILDGLKPCHAAHPGHRHCVRSRCYRELRQEEITPEIVELSAGGQRIDRNQPRGATPRDPRSRNNEPWSGQFRYTLHEDMLIGCVAEPHLVEVVDQDIAIHKLVNFCPTNFARNLPTNNGQVIACDSITGEMMFVLDWPDCDWPTDRRRLGVGRHDAFEWVVSARRPLARIQAGDGDGQGETSGTGSTHKDETRICAEAAFSLVKTATGEAAGAISIARPKKRID